MEKCVLRLFLVHFVAALLTFHRIFSVYIHLIDKSIDFGWLAGRLTG